MTASSAALATANQLPQRSNRVLASTTVRHARARSFVHDASDQRVAHYPEHGMARSNSPEFRFGCTLLLRRRRTSRFPFSSVASTHAGLAVSRRPEAPRPQSAPADDRGATRPGEQREDSALGFLVSSAGPRPLPSYSITWSARCR